MGDIMYGAGGGAGPGMAPAQAPIGAPVAVSEAGLHPDDTYNDFYGAPAPTNSYNNHLTAGPHANPNATTNNNNNNINNTNRQRLPGLYVGNLTWWTTDQDVINAINSVGVQDLQEVKFFENRNNGQSKGFCLVTFNSEASLPIVMEKLPKLELYGQNPVVTLFNRQNLTQFESQTKTSQRPPLNPNNANNNLSNSHHAAGVMGISSISGLQANTQGLPYHQNINSYGQGGPPFGGVGGPGGAPRGPPFHPNMRLPMRASRPPPLHGGPLPNHIIPGGHQMNRMRFMQPRQWMTQAMPMDMGGGRVDNKLPQHQQPADIEPGLALATRRDLDGGGGGHSSSKRGAGDDRPVSRRDTDDSGSGPSLRRDEYSSSSKRSDERSSSRRDPDSSSGANHLSRRSGGDTDSSSRREDRFRREEKSFSSRSRDEKSSRHRSDERARSRSRDKSRERKERRDRDRRDRY